MLTVLAPGLLSSVQDQGRPGWQCYGVSAGGAMDLAAARWANRLVGNATAAAVLELTLGGPTLRLEQGHWLALAGGAVDATLAGRPWPVGSLAWAPAGSTVRLAGLREGCRGWLAVAGGFDVPALMGSRSTALRPAFGGLGGRALKAGDTLAVQRSLLPMPVRPSDAWISPWRLRPAIYTDSGIARLRLVAADELPETSLHALLAAEFSVSSQSDRMGLRLVGPAIAHRAPEQRLSAGLALGSVQLPPDGQPIILGADRQSTGGYPLLGTVASVDHGQLAQLRPGMRLVFGLVTLVEAHAALQRRQRLEAVALAELERRLGQLCG